MQNPGDISDVGDDAQTDTSSTAPTETHAKGSVGEDKSTSKKKGKKKRGAAEENVEDVPATELSGTMVSIGCIPFIAIGRRGFQDQSWHCQHFCFSL